MSISPGATIHPRLTSNTSAPSAGRPLPTRAIRPSSTSTSNSPSRRDAGSTTRPPLINIFIFDPGASPPDPLHALSRAASPARSVRVAHSLCSFASSIGHRLLAGQQVQDCHPHGDAVGDLLENHRVRAVGDVRVDFDAAVHL